MKTGWKQKAVFVVAGVVVVVALPMVWKRLQAARADAEFQHELDLARAEGIPTNGKEFAATIPSVPKEQNAAPFYLKLANRKLYKGNPTELARKVLFEPSSPAAKDARKLLDDDRESIDLVDRATSLPHCWFDRDWTTGIAVLLPELAEMKSAAKILMLRGALAASEGRPDEALKNVFQVHKIAVHLREEPLLMSQLVSRSIDQVGLDQTSWWAYRYPNVAAYREQLRQDTEALPPVDLKAETNSLALEVLTAMDLCETEKGRNMIGLRDDDVAPGEHVMALLQPKEKGRILVVRALRKEWSAVRQPLDKMSELLEEADSELYRGLASFLTASKVVEGMALVGVDREPGGPHPKVQEVKDREARRMVYRAVVRALATSPPPKKLDTSDLIDPLTGKPLRYGNKDGTLTIEAVRSSEGFWPIRIVLPPPKPKSP